MMPEVRCPTGEVRITPRFRLPARYVIHTVGPVWHGGDRGAPELLARCYRGSLALALEHGAPAARRQPARGIHNMLKAKVVVKGGRIVVDTR